MFFDLYKYFARYKKVGTGISFQTLNYSLHFSLLSCLENHKLVMQPMKDCMSPILGKGPTMAHNQMLAETFPTDCPEGRITSVSKIIFPSSVRNVLADMIYHD